MKRIAKLMMTLLRSEITGTEFDRSLFADLTDEDWMHLYELSDAHDLAHLIGDIVLKNGLLTDGATKEKFEKQLMLAVYRYQRIQSELNSVTDVLGKSQIAFIPLKGSVIRQYYPEPWMRTSCDIDILVQQEDVEKAKSRLTEESGYTFENMGEHDIGGYSKSGVHLELHFRLSDESRVRKWDVLLKNVWDYTAKTENEYHRILTPEMFYCYHIAHMAKHFELGGCGIRPFIDLWILNHQPMDRLETQKLLKEGGLTAFSEAVNALTNVWFNGEEASELSCQMEDYILYGGVYGTRDQQIVVTQIKKGGKFRHFISRIWVPYAYLCTLYPKLRGKKILQPFYEVRRWFRLFDRDIIKRSKSELKKSITLTDEEKNKTSQMLSDLGLI